MKTGIIIVIDNDHQNLLTTNLANALSNSGEINFCFVNNGCSDLISNQLVEISEEFENVNVIHVKRKKENSWAVRAGSRFMNNHFKLKFLGYISELQGEELIHAIQVFVDHHGEISKEHDTYHTEKMVKQTFFQRIFSVNNFYREGNFKLDVG